MLQKPLLFDQLVGDIEYVDGKGKSCVRCSDRIVGTAFSNEKLKTGKHYASFEVQASSLHNDFLVGVMRPGRQINCCLLSYSIGDCMSFNPMASQHYYADYLYGEHDDDELFEMFTNEDWEGGPYCWVVSILTRGDQNIETCV